MENKPYHILFKYPTRERPQQFNNNLLLLTNMITDKENCHIVVNIDEDDTKMQGYGVNLIHTVNGVRLSYQVGKNKSKVEAINYGLLENKFDICVLISDDMICQVSGFDNIIRSSMNKFFPDTDGALWFHDGDKNTKYKLCTMVIAGRKYLERFGYIYHSSYKSLFCDDEYTQVALNLKKLYHSGIILFRHDHYMNNSALKPDDLMRKNQSFYGVDRINFIKRLSANFPA